MRFAIIAPLLASPPDHGELQARIAELAAREWKHPSTGEKERFGFKTLERWYYTARSAQERDHVDPVLALARKVPRHAGTHPATSPALALAIRAQHAAHPRWSYQLHHDNLRALSKERPEIGPVPAYPTVRRYMKTQGLYRQKKKRGGRRATSDVEVVSVTLRVARWDLSSVHLVDPRTEAHLATLLPLDKHANSDGRRRAIATASSAPSLHAGPRATGIAPLLRTLMAEYAATGLPPAYLPMHERDDDESNDDDHKEGEMR